MLVTATVDMTGIVSGIYEFEISIYDERGKFGIETVILDFKVISEKDYDFSEGAIWS
jgi:hypothetical protein